MFIIFICMLAARSGCRILWLPNLIKRGYAGWGEQDSTFARLKAPPYSTLYAICLFTCFVYTHRLTNGICGGCKAHFFFAYCILLVYFEILCMPPLYTRLRSTVYAWPVRRMKSSVFPYCMLLSLFSCILCSCAQKNETIIKKVRY